MNNTQKTSCLSIAFQTASAIVAGVVGVNPAFGQIAAENILMRAQAALSK